MVSNRNSLLHLVMRSQNAEHTVVAVYNSGAYAGSLTVRTEDMQGIRSLLQNRAGPEALPGDMPNQEAQGQHVNQST